MVCGGKSVPHRHVNYGSAEATLNELKNKKPKEVEDSGNINKDLKTSNNSC